MFVKMCGRVIFVHSPNPFSFFFGQDQILIVRLYLNHSSVFTDTLKVKAERLLMGQDKDHVQM